MRGLPRHKDHFSSPYVFFNVPRNDVRVRSLTYVRHCEKRHQVKKLLESLIKSFELDEELPELSKSYQSPIL